MVKFSILLILVLGAIFAQLIQAQASNSDIESSDEAGDSNAEKNYNESNEETPALSCLLFWDLGCNITCSLVSGAFSIRGTGKCNDKDVCQCDLDQDDSFEGLFRAKFDAEDTLEKIKQQDNNTVDAVFEVLRVPFQTVNQTITKLRETLPPEIVDNLPTEDSTPAENSNLVKSDNELNYDAITEYVREKLKDLLKSSSDQLKKVDYKLKIQTSLKGGINEDMQSVVNEVRRTKNKNLNDIVNAYLKSANMNEEKNTDKEDIVDAFSHQIIDQFVTRIEQQKKLDERKKRSRRPSNNTRISQPYGRSSNSTIPEFPDYKPEYNFKIIRPT